MDPTANELAKEREDGISSLAVGFVVWMCKRAASSYGETTPGSEVPGSKSLKWSGPDGEA